MQYAGLATRLLKYSLQQKLKFSTKLVKIVVSEVTLERKTQLHKKGFRYFPFVIAITRFFKIDFTIFQSKSETKSNLKLVSGSCIVD